MTSAKPLSSADVRCSMTSSREQLTGNPVLQDYVREPNWLQLSGVAEQILGGAQPRARGISHHVRSLPLSSRLAASERPGCQHPNPPHVLESNVRLGSLAD